VGLGWEHEQKRRIEMAKLKAAGSLTCWICKKQMTPDMKLDLDHVVPRKLGGQDGQVRLTHQSCNRKRGQNLAAKLNKGKKRRKRPQRIQGITIEEARMLYRGNYTSKNPRY
jgi:5-methylcytosine-specific restriction endonuclease McrA